MKKFVIFLSVLIVASITVIAQDTVPEKSQAKSAQQDNATETTDTQPSATDPWVSEDATAKGSFWMEQKLRFTTKILAGLAEGDFEKIGKNATLMRGINRVEQFVRREPAGYKDELKLFNMANRAILKAADEENLEAATLAFNRLTVSCVSCHQSLREK